MKKNSYLVLTGAMGGGKSTILTELLKKGETCVPEPAREILFEQRLIGSQGVPEKNSDLFTMLLLSRSLHDYSEYDSFQRRVIFDRGVPDMIAYAKLFGLDLGPYEKAAEQFRYNDHVFYFPPWEAIYSNDEERKIGFQGAREFGIQTKQIYQDLGYKVIEVPLVSVADRVQFILEKLKELAV